MNGINKYAKITSLLDKLQKQFFLKLSKNRQPSQKQDVSDGEKYKKNNMITKRQLELLSYINLIFNTRGEIPTYEEMKKMMKVKSKSTAIEALKGLVK